MFSKKCPLELVIRTRQRKYKMHAYIRKRHFNNHILLNHLKDIYLTNYYLYYQYLFKIYIKKSVYCCNPYIIDSLSKLNFKGLK